MAIVTGIREYRGVVVISLDGRGFARVKKQFFDQNPLAEGDAIDEDAYIDRVAQAQFKAAYEAALTSLETSARTSVEIKKTLARKGFVAPAIEAALERLIEARLIDDKAYAERVVELEREKPVGVYAIKRKLRAKGIDEDTVEEMIEGIDELEQIDAARRMAEKLHPRYRDLEPRQARAKLSQALARRGFSWDVIGTALENLMGDEWE